MNLNRYGNTSAASIGIALDELVRRENKFRPQAGLGWFRWRNDRRFHAIRMELIYILITKIKNHTSQKEIFIMDLNKVK